MDAGTRAGAGMDGESVEEDKKCVSGSVVRGTNVIGPYSPGCIFRHFIES